MKLYRIARDWIDQKNASPFSGERRLVLLPGVVAALPFIVAASSFPAYRTPLWAAAGLILAGWAGLVFWRLAKTVRADAVKADEAYDRSGKYKLPPEYADTESATAARLRKDEKRSD